ESTPPSVNVKFLGGEAVTPFRGDTGFQRQVRLPFMAKSALTVQEAISVTRFFVSWRIHQTTPIAMGIPKMIRTHSRIRTIDPTRNPKQNLRWRRSSYHRGRP